ETAAVRETMDHDRSPRSAERKHAHAGPRTRCRYCNGFRVSRLPAAQSAVVPLLDRDAGCLCWMLASPVREHKPEAPVKENEGFWMGCGGQFATSIPRALLCNSVWLQEPPSCRRNGWTAAAKSLVQQRGSGWRRVPASVVLTGR